MNTDKKVVVIAGPTGSGESTITHAIIKKFPTRFARLVTATTRAPRNNEQHGIHYYYLTEQDFKKGIETGDILEHTFIENRNVYYGSYKPDLEKRFAEGKVVIANPDIVGARFFKEHYDALTIFVMPESLDSLKMRLQKRDTHLTDTELEMRIENARKEIEEEKDFYDYEVVNADGKLNDAIDATVDILRKEGYIA